MSNKKPDLSNPEDAMACAAFNEAGEPCPGVDEISPKQTPEQDTANCAPYEALAEDCPADAKKDA